MAKHRYAYKAYLKNEKKSDTSYEVLKHDDAYIELLEEFPCANKAQLCKREGELIREHEKKLKDKLAAWYKQYVVIKLEINIDRRLINKNSILDRYKESLGMADERGEMYELKKDECEEIRDLKLQYNDNTYELEVESILLEEKKFMKSIEANKIYHAESYSYISRMKYVALENI